MATTRVKIVGADCAFVHNRWGFQADEPVIVIVTEDKESNRREFAITVDKLGRFVLAFEASSLLGLVGLNYEVRDTKEEHVLIRRTGKTFKEKWIKLFPNQEFTTHHANPDEK